MQISKFGNAIKVGSIQPTGAITGERSIHVQDEIIRLNGHNIAGKSVGKIADMMGCTEDPLLLDIKMESIHDADDSGYSEHSPCPYYLSRALAEHAELIFCPYNYVLDPLICKSLDIHLEGAVVVLGMCSQDVGYYSLFV